MRRLSFLPVLLAIGFAVACGRADRPGTERAQDTRAPAVMPSPTTASAGNSAAGGEPAALREQVVYVDVRTPQEFAAAHVRGALNIPYDQISSRAGELESYRDRHIVLYCHSGRRAGLAYEVLRSKGFENIENGGGLEDLARAGVAVTGS